MPEWLRIMLFFLVVYALYAALHVYVYVRLVRGLVVSVLVRRTIAFTMGVLGSLYLLGRGLGHFVGWEIGLPLLWPGSAWLGYFCILLTLVAMVDLVITLPFALVRRMTHLSDAMAIRRTRWNRRVRMSLPFLAIVLSGLAVYNAIQPPGVTELDVRLPGLPEEMDGITMVQVSDVHVGALVTLSLLDRLVDQVNALKPDIVVLTGDLTDERGGGDVTTGRIWARLKSRLGVFAVTGNHEYYSGGEEVVQTLAAWGIRFLRQENVTILGGLTLAGIDDPTILGGRDEVPSAIGRALAWRKQDRPVILLSHQPVGVEYAADAGVDLMLSGHTHGGQIPPFLWLSRIQFKFFAGTYHVRDLMLYVSQGAGFWGPPMRLLADAEVVRITLHPTRGETDGTR